MTNNPNIVVSDNAVKKRYDYTVVVYGYITVLKLGSITVK